MVARNQKYGRFFGVCDAVARKCTVTGLKPDTEYEIWLRHCTGPIYNTEKDACTILVNDPLNDCTDSTSKYLENKYIIHAMGPSGIFVSDVVRATTLPNNRKLFLSLKCARD